MIIAEILSLFLRTNAEVARKYKKILGNFAIEIKTISFILDYQLNFLKLYFQRYSFFKEYISYDY
jgi:hypothetical protein